MFFVVFLNCIFLVVLNDGCNPGDHRATESLTWCGDRNGRVRRGGRVCQERHLRRGGGLELSVK